MLLLERVLVGIQLWTDPIDRNLPVEKCFVFCGDMQNFSRVFDFVLLDEPGHEWRNGCENGLPVTARQVESRPERLAEHRLQRGMMQNCAGGRLAFGVALH